MRIFDATGPDLSSQTVTVPAGLDGRLWFLRLYAGTGSDLSGDDPAKYRRPTLNAKLVLQGVPPYLSPSWTQWFNPKR